MANAVPKWVWKRYALLWKKFNDKKFTFTQAKEELKYLDGNTLSVLFNELKRAKWIDVSLDEKDSRKRFYCLINPVRIVEGVEK